LTLHVISSVGWLGAVVAFLVLSVTGVRSHTPETVRAVYIAMNIIGLLVIVPLSIASLLTGIVQGLGTPWGLFRYYWVVTKLALTIGATALLMLHQFMAVATAAEKVMLPAPGSLPDVGPLANQLVFDAGLAIVVLLVTTTLSVFKPWGRIRERMPTPLGTGGNIQVSGSQTPTGTRVLILLVGLLLAGVVVFHLVGGTAGHHRR
jgi:hypothetical protein